MRKKRRSQRRDPTKRKSLGKGVTEVDHVLGGGKTVMVMMKMVPREKNAIVRKRKVMIEKK